MRDVYWDVVKGSAMVLVLLGHTGMAAMPYLYMFHVALFFFVAGALFKWEHAEEPFAYFGSRLRRLWWPGVKYGALFVLLHNVFCALGVYAAVPPAVDAVGIPHATPQVPYTGREFLVHLVHVALFSHWEELLGALWFLELMVVALAFLAGLAHLVRGYRLRSLWLLFLSVPFYLLGCYFCLTDMQFPLHFQVALVLLLPLAAGCFWREVHARVPLPLKWGAALGGLVALVYVYHATGTWVELSLNRVIGPKWFLLATFGGFAFWLGVCHLLVRVRPVCWFLSLVGRESLHVMALHFLGFRLATWLLIVFAGLPWIDLAAFPVVGYPIRDATWFLYVVCGLLFPLACVMVCRRIGGRMMCQIRRCMQAWKRGGMRCLATTLFLFWGIVLSVTLPPYDVPDEMLHLYRSWQLSEGVFFPAVMEGEISFYGTRIARSSFAEVPAALVEPALETVEAYQAPWDMSRTWSFLSTPLALDVTMQASVATVGGYGPLGYMPQTAACFVGKGLAALMPGLSAGFFFYFVRLCCLAFGAVCLFFALTLLPEKQVFLAVFALTPMYLAQCSSASMDAVVLPVLLLLAAYFLSGWRHGLLPIRRRCLDVVAAVLLGALKGVYAPLLVLAVLPRGDEGMRRDSWRYLLLLLSVAAATAAGWSVLSRLLAGPMPIVSAGADPARQLAFLVAHPLSFWQALGYSLWADGLRWLEELLGVLGWLAVYLPAWFYVLYAGILLGAALCGSHLLRVRERRIALLALVVSALLIFAAEYVAWTPVQELRIAGVQGRYFLPLLAVAGMTFGGDAVSFAALRQRWFVGAAAMVSGCVTLAAVVQFFYLR